MTVDILLPYYGDVVMMKEAVRSVLRQGNPHWRLVVVDDGYPDDSVPGWFESLDDPRITYERNEKNLGANANYRKCLTFVENPLVQVMGADDVMLPNYVDWLVDAAKRHPRAGVFQPGVVVIDEAGAQSSTMVEKVKRFYMPRGRSAQLLTGERFAVSVLRGDWLYFPSLAWRAETILGIGFREGYDVVQDLALVCDVAMSGKGLLYDPTLAFMYRRHSGSDSSWRALEGTRFNEERRFFLQMASEMRARGWRRAARVSRLHVSSRLHAGSLLPRAVRVNNRTGIRNLARHIVR